MASAVESSSVSPAQAPTGPTSPRGRSNRGRGRGGFGGPRHEGHANDDNATGDSGRRGGFRGRGRGRGHRSRSHSQLNGASEGPGGGPAPAVPPPPLTNRGAFSARLTADAIATEGENGEKREDGEEVEAETEAQTVIFTDDATKRFEDYRPEDFASSDEGLGIKYEKIEIFEDTVLLLRYNCPDPSCDVACLGWPDLHRHVKSVHHRVMCDLCTRNKKVFTHEHELFTINELRKHEKYGDDNPGAVDQSGFKGHPECGFCRQRFYGDDELYTHCRDKHERCHICDRRNQGRQQQYFQDYNSLEVHFRKAHFLCLDQECLDKKFVVFDSEMDLKAHQLETHPNGSSKDARRDARRVDISSFDYRTPHTQDRGGRREREGRGGGRGRDPNAEPIPQSTAQPMRRDELAYQRQMAIQSAQSVTSRTFGGQLTAEPPVPRSQARPDDSLTVTAPRQAVQTHDAFPSISSLNLGSSAAPSPRPSSPTQPLTPQEQARRLRHAAVIDRAAALLRNDATKLSTFRTHISSYRLGAISAPDLIDAFFALFDNAPVADLGKLIKELAEIFEIETKRDALLKAWADWKAIHEDYPSLPSAGGAGGGAMTAARVLGGAGGGSRVLKLKSSTAQSSRSAVGRQGSWGSASPLSGSGHPFPPMPAASSANRAGPGK
ncbi:hypothetical protein LTR39_001632, partial [Cryomyces antarcticus]